MALAGHLEKQLTRLQQLLELLREERTVLLEGRVDGARLSQLAENKQAQLEAVENFERQRRQALLRLGYSDNRAGDEGAAADAGCLPLWRTICECAAEVAELNRGNGALIEIRVEHNRHLLDFLQAAAGKDLYGPDGRAQPHSGRINSRA
ncbi:flagella synthesis protein FlgN [Microbulbifer thermotolerans]|uniref:Flagellar protein FlgN n=1 Tax=Microbulbifer thermotolerans TaxID=252514 RepID=A0AB35HXX3_MICTH|nr:flagellar protein FlgN [Microbulbifer thermotolerans]MCX2780098.1 flagellar protein FlgN [Microbulbifer thermotolerans]MCX2802124.1 flagellar protein FlgN [Microbulbifer thermotolerans]MCX2805522.1 flagellar protein FlgN [Microbulbifer thermotolerans]MCX2831951.1 flagellar protein FlgN [Microbulbifer thermotolerans]MCX2842484.1 flagellar protein FlgN [Microbulbifer thermotolerans]